MANEIGTTLVNSITSSTFDVGNMAKVLAEAEVAGATSILDKNREKANTELNALTYLQSNISAFKTYVTDLSNPETFSKYSVSSSNDSLISGTATGSVTNGSYQIEARQLAQANTQVANKVYSSTADSIATGTLSISVAGSQHDITIDGTNNTLEGLQRTINNGDYGVSASVINTGNGYQLMFTSKETGAANQMQISGIADIDVNGLTTTSVAQDAVMVINGLSVTSTKNTFDEVIPGMSIDLKSAQPGVVNTLSVSQDTSSMVETVQSFVEVYNQLDTILDELGSYEELTSDQVEDEAYQYWGDLAGSSVLRQVRSELQSSISGVIDELGSSYNSLSMIGLSIDRDGVMEVDESKLQSVAAQGLDYLKNVFARGGSSDDPLVNVLGGNDRTQTGSYELEISQVATRATSSSTATLDTDERVAGGQVFDQEAMLTLEDGSFELNGTTINFAAGSYADSAGLLAYMQGQIDSAITGAGGANGDYLIDYDTTQSRFEITAADTKGAVDLTNVVGLSNQGFTQTNYSGEQLVNLTAGSFDVAVNGSDVTTFNMAAGDYTLSEIASYMQSSLNGSPELQSAGSSVSVTADNGELSIISSRYGTSSKVEISNVSGLTELSLLAGSETGQNVDGKLYTDSGSISIGAYVDGTDGRRINISNFAPQEELRGLQFEVLGGAFDDGLGGPAERGTITFVQGFASRLEEAITNIFEADNGLVTQRIESLNSKNEDYDAKQEKLDARYETLLLKYQLQFSALQSILSSAEQTRSYLSQTFSNSSDS